MAGDAGPSSRRHHDALGGMPSPRHLSSSSASSPSSSSSSFSFSLSSSSSSSSSSLSSSSCSYHSCSFSSSSSFSSSARTLFLILLFLSSFFASLQPCAAINDRLVSSVDVRRDESDLQDNFPTKEPKCDRKIVSSENGLGEGKFEAPELDNPEGHGRQCLYTFVAGPGERVQIRFNRFSLRGTPPDGSTLGLSPACNHEYLDIYTEIKDPTKEDLLNTPFGGRYCGSISPRLRISLYNTVVISFYTDFANTSTSLFHGTYKFINESRYISGDLQLGTLCGYVIHSEVQRNGQFMTLTYPGAYPKNITCYYKFIGKKGQRIRLEFRDFDLFYGGPHCPFDQVKIYDGSSQVSSLIGTYCGQQRNLVIFSTSSSLLLTFNTLDRIADTQNRGFQGIYNFSESYVNLAFINASDSEHIRGTECDQRILSKKESNGTVYSPNYPFPYPPNIVCRYFIYGLQDAQNLERVRLQFFENFDIPAEPKGDKNCSDGYLRIYLKGQETENAYDNPDHEVCGKTLPQTVVSSGPRLVMVFSSGKYQGGRFKAHYKFETEYKIPGTPSPDGKCIFTYYSSSRKEGTFNSPRHPANYPSSTTCEYTFQANPDEQVRLAFYTFELRSEKNNLTYGNHCQEDWVEIYNVYRPEGSAEERQRLNGRYCGQAAPGPIESEMEAVGLRVVLRTDSKHVHSGFQAIYQFKKKDMLFRDCGGNITNEEYGIIRSPHWPNKYDGPDPDRQGGAFSCTWFIHVRPYHKVLLWLQSFSVEGNPAERGCPAAVVRVWPDLDKVPIELCGEGLTDDASLIISKSSLVRVAFLTADRAVGAKGFEGIWTEIQDSPKCEQFLCSKNNFCISKNLRCNGVLNCGVGDVSDEDNCIKDPVVNVLMLVGVGLGISSVLLIVVCIWCHRKHVKRREEGALPHHVHVCERGARFASVDSVGHSALLDLSQQAFGYLRLTPHISLLPSFHATLQGDRNLSPVLGARQAHHLSRTSLRTETVV
ncbi:cubilin-like isoform X3 [Portunus trituberculatus]|uniref:cubilin-like isoform X3 n=1 Tax=Portunus trituberculatus TaxID=210409 RepID=UPI001E1CDE17|nr:cubilin-like isoform X3 [Portunus trituberculatus]